MKMYVDYISSCSECPHCDGLGDCCDLSCKPFREYRHKSIPPWCELEDAPQKTVEAKPEQHTTAQV